MTDVFLRRLTRWQADQQREVVADMYVKAYGDASDGRYGGRREFLRRFADHMQQPGFEMVIANGTGPAGFAYGFTPGPAGGHREGFRGDLPDLSELAARGRLFAMVELLVVPHCRRAGVATRLHDKLIAGTDADLVAGFVEPTDEIAAAACLAWGWTRAGEVSATSERARLDLWSRRVTPLRP